jgi:hypothetical protein
VPGVPVALPVHDRWIVKGPGQRSRALRAAEVATRSTGLTHSVDDCPEVGALGLLMWTVIDFTAQHGDYARLHHDVLSAVDHDCGVHRAA